MLAALASGYHGPPQLTFSRAFTSWHLDPWSLAVILVVAALYLAGVRRLVRRGGTWRFAWAFWICVLGLGFYAVATMSSIGIYTPVLFYMRSVQTILVLLVVPLFVALGRPLTLVIGAVPGFGPWLDWAIKTKVAKLLTFPAITTFVLVITPFLIYFTPWYAAGFSSGPVMGLTHLAMMAPGFVFFWTLLRVDPVPKAYPYVVALWITAAEVIGDAILGLAVVADTGLIAGHYYQALARPWGPNLQTAQVLGGGVLWIVGDIVGLPFLAAQLIQMIREDEHDAEIIDAELDAADAAALAAASMPLAAGAAAGAGGTAAAGEAGAGSAPGPRGTNQPWWETDSRFADRFRGIDDD